MQLFGFVILDFITSVQGALFSHFDVSYFLFGKKKRSVLVKWINSTKLPTVVTYSFCQFRTKNTHTVNHAPTALGLRNVSAHCRFLSGDANVFLSQVVLLMNITVKVSGKLTASPHLGPDCGSKVRDSPAVLTR